MYKLSRFTFYTINSKNELLLYNTLVGKRSLCKLSAEFSDIVRVQYYFNDIENHMDFITILLDKGIIVDAFDDENNKLYENFLSNISPTNLTLHINPTEKCNFRCKYCYESFNHGAMSGDVQKNIIDFVRQNIHKYTGLHVSWFGGEPLMAIDCIRYLSKKLMNICKYNRIPYSSGITTNGYLLKQDIFNELLDLNIKSYQITIDGIKSIHDQQRVTLNNCGTYDKIVENLCSIHENNRKDFEILIRSNITSEIFENLDEYISTINTICANDDRFMFDFHKVGNWMGKASNSLLPKIIDNLDELQIIYDKLLNSEFSGRLSFGLFYPGNGSCYAGKRNQFLIRSNGNVHKCTVDFEKSGTQVGTINEGKMDINQKYYSNIVDINNCKSFYDCFFAPVCMGTPCPNDKNSGCPYTKNYLGISLKILDKNYPLELIKV